MGAWSWCEAGVGYQFWRVPDLVVVLGGTGLSVGRRKGVEL